MRKLFLILLAAGLSGCDSAKPAETPTPSATPAVTSLKVITEAAQLGELKASLKLTGQVVPTEAGKVKITAPLDGTIVRPLLRVGDVAQRDEPLAEENSVYGLTSMQILEKLEASQNAAVSARSQLSTALTNLTQARTALGNAQFQAANVTSEMLQAQAELKVSSTDMRRKTDLMKAGVFAQADVDEATARWNKAQAAVSAGKHNVDVANAQVPLAQRNVSEAERATHLAQQAVEIAEANYQRNRAVLSQRDLVGTDVPGGLSAVPLSGGATGGARAATSFYVRSPISGIITELQMSAGLKVSAGTELGTVVDISSVYVDANAFEADVSQLKEGDSLTVTQPSVPGHTFSGRIRYLGRKVNPDTHTIQVRSLISNRQGLLRPDQFVDVTVHLPERARTVLVNDRAILSLEGQDWVMVETKPGDYEKRSVQVGARANGRAEIVKGLKAGEKVVVDGNLLLETRER